MRRSTIPNAIPVEVSWITSYFLQSEHHEINDRAALMRTCTRKIALTSVPSRVVPGEWVEKGSNVKTRCFDTALFMTLLVTSVHSVRTSNTNTHVLTIFRGELDLLHVV